MDLKPFTTSFLRLLTVVLLTLTIALPLIITSCGTNTESDRKTLPDTLKIAVELSSMTLSTTNDTISGFSFEVLQRICNQHNIPYLITPFNNINDILNETPKEDFDIYVSNLPVTAKVKERFLSTQPLYTDKLILVQNTDLRPDSLITAHLQLGGKPVWIIKSDAVTERLNNLSQEIGEDILIVDTNDISEEQLVILVSLGEIPRAAVSSLTALSLLEFYNNLDTSVDLSFNQFKSWLLAERDTALRDTLDLWLESFKATPEFEALSEKYNINKL